jgi:hypothetical protein
MDDEADSDGSGEDSAESEADLEGKYHSVTDSFEDVELGGLPPIAPDGGFIADPLGMAPSVPAADPRIFICLRGPCRFYWERQAFFESGNPKETWGEGGLVGDDGEPIEMPRQIDRTCTAHPGTETELTDELVYDCSKWDPLTPREIEKRDKARRRYYKHHPDHDPTLVSVERLRRH